MLCMVFGSTWPFEDGACADKAAAKPATRPKDATRLFRVIPTPLDRSSAGIVKLTKTASGQPPGIAVGAAANTTNCAAVRRSFVNLTMPNSHLGLLRPERCEVDTTQSTRAVVRPTG